MLSIASLSVLTTQKALQSATYFTFTFTGTTDMVIYDQWRRNEFESGGTGPERKWGALIRREAPENFFWLCPPLFGSESTISSFGDRFRDGQYSLVSFLFAVLLLTVPPLAQPFVKVGARAPVPHGVGATVHDHICRLDVYFKSGVVAAASLARHGFSAVLTFAEFFFGQVDSWP